MKYYYLYEIKIDNPDSGLDGCYYYGKHVTSNLEDNYYGSGKLIRRYKDKYGIKGLTKTILTYFNSEEELNEGEKILIKEKKELLKDKCINLNDGETGSFTYLNNLYTREERSQIMLSTSTPEQRHERAVIGGNANKKRLENKEALEDFRQKMIQVHANMSEEEKRDRYDKVSKSLKEYYQSEKGQEELKQRNLKNKETNQKVSRQWREEFKEIFNGKQPESFRKYGKQKESHQLFKEIKNLPKEEQKIKVDNFFQSLNS